MANYHGLFWQGELEPNYVGHILAEIYKDKIYAPYLIGKKDLTVLDIGANIGLFSHFISSYASQVYSLEPSTEHFATLNHMLDYNQIKNVKPIQKALYTEVGTFGFGGPVNNKTMKSLHMGTWEGGQPEEQVETTTLEQLFKDEGIKHVDLMKLDVEGSEAEILGHESFSNVADKIDVIVMEMHSWMGRHPNQVKESLKNAGFRLETVPNDAQILVARRD